MSVVSDPSITIVPEEERETRRRLATIATDAFQTPQDYFVSLTPHTLAARVDGELVGGAILEVVDGPAGDVGIVSWLFTAPTAQGHGVGSELVDAAIDYLEDQGCRAIVTVVQWRNTASSSLFARRGFERVPSSALARRFGLKQGGLVWLETFHFLNVGCDLWCLELAEGRDGSSAGPPDGADSGDATRNTRDDRHRPLGGSAGRLLETVLVHVALLTIVVGGLDVRSWTLTTLALGAVGGLVIALRWLPFLAVAARDGRRWSVSSWGNVYPFAGAIALLGGFLPVPGHLAPERSAWDYRDARPVLGPAATAWGLALLAILVGVVGVGGGLEGAHLHSLVLTLTVFVVVDLWVIVWPFDSYSGRLIYDWNRGVWAVLSVIGGLVLGVYYFG